MEKGASMKYKLYSFRNADIILNNDNRYVHLWNDIRAVLDGIMDEDIIYKFNLSTRKEKKSISDDINELIDERMCARG